MNCNIFYILLFLLNLYFCPLILHIKFSFLFLFICVPFIFVVFILLLLFSSFSAIVPRLLYNFPFIGCFITSYTLINVHSFSLISFFSDFILLFIIYLFIFYFLFIFIFYFLQAIRYQEILFLGKKNKNNANIHPTYPEIVSEIKEKFDKLQLSSSLYYKISLFLLNKSYLSFYISTILLFYCLTIFLLYLRLAKLFLIHTEYLIFYFLFFI